MPPQRHLRRRHSLEGEESQKKRDLLSKAATDQEIFKNLPSEVIIDILSRLPIGSIRICKCVSKSWLGLLVTDEFVKLHHSRSVPCLVMGFKTIGIYELQDDLDLEHHEFHAAFKSNLPWVSLFGGSANGLLFLIGMKYDGSHNLYICNPLTREYVEIKPPTVTFDYSEVFHGFGASKMTGQHKVITIYRNNECIKVEGHVYTLETGLWRSIAPSDHLNYGFYEFGVFMNGNLHWLVFNSNCWSQLISCFDLETELFSTFSCPLLPEGEEFCCKVSALDHCLCVCYNTYDGGIVIWLMKEYGVEKSWTRQIVINDLFDKSHLVWPIKVFRDGDILMKMQYSRLFCYSVKTKTTREIGKGAAILHTPTFLSLKSFGIQNVSKF